MNLYCHTPNQMRIYNYQKYQRAKENQKKVKNNINKKQVEEIKEE